MFFILGYGMANSNAKDVTLTSIHLVAEDNDSHDGWLQLSPDEPSQNKMPKKNDWNESQEWALPFEPLSPSILSNELATSPDATCSWMGNPGSMTPNKTPTKAKRSGKKNGASKAGSPTALPPPLSRAEALGQYEELMANKGQMDTRRYNKMVHALLDSCIVLIKSQQGEVSNALTVMDPGNFNLPGSDWSNEQESLSKFRELLLNSKEIVSEQLIARVIAYIQRGLPPLLTADEKKDMLLKRSLAFVAELSPQLCIKIAPVIRSHVARIFDSQLENLFAEIRMPEMPMREKSLVYCRMLSNFIDHPECVSFAATNKSLLGKISPVDIWFLTFFACVLSRRIRGDNLLQLGCVGN